MDSFALPGKKDLLQKALSKISLSDEVLNQQLAKVVFTNESHEKKE